MARRGTRVLRAFHFLKKLICKRKIVEAEGDSTSYGPRKELHNATEKRRREKINYKINELREIIPQAKNYGNNKASVLQTAVEHIKQLNSNYNQLVATNRQLQETNTQLLNELRELHRLLWARARDHSTSSPFIVSFARNLLYFLCTVLVIILFTGLEGSHPQNTAAGYPAQPTVGMPMMTQPVPRIMGV